MPRPADRAAADQFARKYGIPTNIFRNLIAAESGWNPNALSPAGALGYTQLMPGTAKSLRVDPRNPLQNLEGGARYLRQQYDRFGNWRLALAAYNAGPGAVEKYGGVPPYEETQAYVRKILAAAAGAGGQTGGGAARITASVASAAPPDLSGVAFENLSHMGRPRQSAVAALSALTQAVATAPQQSTPVAIDGTPALAPAADVDKWVRIAASANRAGAPLHAATIAYVAEIARLRGKPLTIGTGTNHSEFVAGTNRVSEHWHGDAADIPARGLELIKLGRAALIAAGADPKWARKQRGGLFNVNGYQIIFNTSGPNVGGDHTNHLHVGVGRARSKPA